MRVQLIPRSKADLHAGHGEEMVNTGTQHLHLLVALHQLVQLQQGSDAHLQMYRFKSVLKGKISKISFKLLTRFYCSELVQIKRKTKICFNILNEKTEFYEKILTCLNLI